jgi:hypothetical protein
MKSVRDAGVIDRNGPSGQVANDSAPVGVHMIVSVPDIVMLVVRLGLLIGQALVAALRINIGRVEMGRKNRGE